VWKRLDIRASWDLGIKVRILKTLKISLRGNKSIMAVFDSQVVRLDVFLEFLRLCGQVGCWLKNGVVNLYSNG